jgi:uncharacterized protein YjiS (DUF1127 family)
MTTISSTSAQPARVRAPGGFARQIGIWVNALAAYWVRREAIKALHLLNDRELRDIGISRAHIESAVRGFPDPDIWRMR